MQNDVTIEVKNVSKIFRIYGDKGHTFKDKILFHKRNKYEKHVVLNNISFSVRKGQAVGLIGHNGCGKSTTLKLLNRILYPDAGSIEMHGKISSLIELGAGFHPDMTGRENIYINATIFGLTKKEIDKRLDDIITFSELEQFIDSPVRTYSSGMYMRLAFSIAINVDADILLVDEILAVGDANFQKKCFDKLAEIKKYGATIVIVSHSMDQIKSICDRVLWIDSGEIREDGDAFQVCDDYLTAMRDAAESRKRLEAGEDVNADPNVLYPISKISTQYGKNSRRFGNMQARFTNVTLCDEKGEPCTNFKYMDNFLVKFGIEYDKDVKVNVLFNIIEKDGVWLGSLESRLSLGKYLPCSAFKEGSLLIHDIPLAVGDYILECVIRLPDGTDLDGITHFIYFHVETEQRMGSRPLALDNHWKLY